VDREFASARQATALRELLPPLAVPVGAEVA
jgi:hypothetical protein